MLFLVPLIGVPVTFLVAGVLGYFKHLDRKEKEEYIRDLIRDELEKDN